MAKNYCAVKKGYTIGIFKSWDECQASVNGYSGTIFK
ncbi:MAG: RNase H1/viroplasmin domain-containing protein [Christensenellaceae bacterium]|nr:RNase H1/viroplasmin domain-containing protein [Christensenellaceae bacterium]